MGQEASKEPSPAENQNLAYVNGHTSGNGVSKKLGPHEPKRNQSLSKSEFDYLSNYAQNGLHNGSLDSRPSSAVDAGSADYASSPMTNGVAKSRRLTLTTVGSEADALPSIRPISESGTKPPTSKPAFGSSIPKTGWMRPSQAKPSVTSSPRLPTPPPAVPGTTRPRFATVQTKSGKLGSMSRTCSIVEEEMIVHAEESEPVVERKLEENKKEVVSRLQKFMKWNSNRSSNYFLAEPMPDFAALPQKIPYPAQSGKESWMSNLARLRKEARSRGKKEKEGKEEYLEPLTQGDIAQKVESSLGEGYAAFSGFQGAVHSLAKDGVKDEVLNSLFTEERERQLPTYEKWRVIRRAAEQLLQVYANRSNAQWIEKAKWTPPSVLDSNAFTGTVYANAVDTAISRDNIALMFIDDGRLVEMGEGNVCPILCADLWKAMKEVCPARVPSGQRLERLSVAGRHLLQAAVSIETWYGANALKQLKVVVAVDVEQEHYLVSELQAWSFFGLQPEHVVLLPLPRFHGFAQDPKSGRLAHVQGSQQLLLGTGYAMFLLNSVSEAYVVKQGAGGPEPMVLPGSVLDWLLDQRVGWLYTGLFSDVERLRPEGIFDVEFLASAMYGADRMGANMAVEVFLGERERDARTHDSIVLGREGQPGCNSLRPSDMRTVESFSVLSTQAANPHGFYVSSHRYAFKVAALQRLLVDASNFHADVRLHNFYAYAMFDIGDITTFPEANCMAVLGQGRRGPPMNEVVYGRSWLSSASKALEMQDHADDFRRKAMQCLTLERVASVRTLEIERVPSGKYREKPGFTVALVLSPDHIKIAKAALRMARLFIHRIVDRLHIVVVMSTSDTRTKAHALLKELVDKELEYNGQVVRAEVARPTNARTADSIITYLEQVNAQMVVVPSEKLCAVQKTDELGSLSAQSLAYMLVLTLHTMPVLIVKSNSAGKFVSPAPEKQPVLTTMCHLENTGVAAMVEAVARRVVLGPHDRLLLARTKAFEHDQLSMRSKRIFVQARMAMPSSLRVEERAYAKDSLAELPKAVEAEGVDLLVLSATQGLSLSKEVEALLKVVKACVFIFRSSEAEPTVQGRF